MLDFSVTVLMSLLFVFATVDKGPKRRKKNKATADHFKQVLCMLCTLLSGNGGSAVNRQELCVVASF